MNKPTRTPKQDAAAMIAAMPDDASIEEIFYRLYVLEHIRAGAADIEAGRTVPHEEVVADLRKWLDE
jgi:predicted transcriptional regulator